MSTLSVSLILTLLLGFVFYIICSTLCEQPKRVYVITKEQLQQILENAEEYHVLEDTYEVDTKEPVPVNGSSADS